MRIRCAVLAMLLLGAAWAARAEEPLTQDHVAAYVAVVKADQARDAGQKDAAIKLYRDAMQKYQSIARQYPDWHPDVVQYRLSYCENEVSALQRRGEGSPARPTPAGEAPALAPPDPVTAEALQRLAQMEKDDAALRAENASLQADLAAAQKARLDAPELADARAEASQWRDQVAALSNRLDAAARAQDESAAQLQQRMAQAEADTAALRAENSTLQADLAAAQKARQKSPELKAAREAASELGEQLEAISNRLASAVRERDEAARDLAAAREREGELKGKLKTAQKGSKELEALRAERDRLRDDLQAAEQAGAALGQEQIAATEQRAEALSRKYEDAQRDLQACAEARDAALAQLAAATSEVARLSALPPPEATPAAEAGVPAVAPDPLPQMKAEVGRMRETLDAAGRQLDESREAALQLLEPVPAAR